MIQLDLSILNQKGTPMFNSDIFANRPAAGIAGRIFISTDTFAIFRDTGSTWDAIGGGSATIAGTISAGQVAFGTALNTIGGNNALYWDNINQRLGIGSAPTNSDFEINKQSLVITTYRNQNNGVNLTNGANVYQWDITGQRGGINSTLARMQVFYNGDGITRRGKISFSVAETSGFGGGLFTLTQTAGNFKCVNLGPNANLYLDNDTTITTTYAQHAQTIIAARTNFPMMSWDINGVVSNIMMENGNLLLNTTTDAGQKLQVIGNSYFSQNVQIGSTTAISSTINLQVTGRQYTLHTTTYSGAAVQTFTTFKNVTINQTITGGNGINNQINTGLNIFSSTQSVPETTTYANIFNYNEYRFSDAGITLSADQATGGIRTISQLTTQNVFGGSFNGTMSHVSGIQINGYYNNATGTITPTITNAYQLLINDTGEFGHTFTFDKRWGIYQRGINDRNYLEGNLLLNSTTDTGQILQVNGAIRVNGQLSGTSGGNSGQHLIINCDGTTYKIALQNP